MMLLGEATNSAVWLTTSVTGMVCGGPLEGVTVIVPEYAPGVNPAVFTPTAKLPGATPVVDETVSQVGPVLVCDAATVYPT